MNKQIAAIIVAVSMAGGIGTGVLAYAVTNDKLSPEQPAVSVSTPPAHDQPATSFVLAPGSVGPVRVGFTREEALATGLFDADVPPQVDGCATLPLRWKEQYEDDFDVLTLNDGEIVSIGVRGAATTEHGVGVGSTYREVHARYPEELLTDAGYGQSGLRVPDPDTGGWIGFLFNPPPDQIKDDSPVTFVELTKGGAPDLVRDGC